jgi:T5SS/PEP-CTERM-associated repeat protein
MGLIGFSPGSSGTVTVTGAGSEWTNYSSLYVGRSGSGTLAIEAAGRVDSSGGNLGETSGSTGTATVTGNGSMWTTSSSLNIGRYGNGSLAIEAGGLVNSFSGYLGQFSGSTGKATVNGSGSKWINRTGLYIGRSGNGTLAITAGGQVSSAGGYLGDNSGSSGTATVAGAGSKWTITFSLYVGESGNGKLTIEDGGLVSVGGTLTIDNHSPGQSSINITTGGMLALYGNADDSLSQFLELVQGTDAIRFWDDSLSAWAPLASATFGEDYTLEYLSSGDLAGYTLLTVGAASSPGLTGDFNADGSVDGADFLAWQRGESPDPLVEGDLTAWKTNFGASAFEAGSGVAVAASVSVPEPTTGALALLIPLAGLHCRAASKKRRSFAAS